jgi:hypothetical protein
MLFFGITGCVSPPSLSYLPDYKANAFAPGNNYISNMVKGNFFSIYDEYACSGKNTLDEAMNCAIQKCETGMSKRSNKNAMHVPYLVPYQCVAFHLYGDSVNSSSDVPQITYTPGIRWEFFVRNSAVEKIYLSNTELQKQARNDGFEHLGLARRSLETKKQKTLAAQKKKAAETLRLKKQKEEEALEQQFKLFIEQKKKICESYGFNGDNAIATCIQKEINLEKDRIQANLLAQKNQPIIQQAQPSYRNSGPNWDALGSMGSCLQTEGSFAACSNAWQGYTPPRKTVTKCRYDTFGNVITGTCTTQ